MPNMFRNFTYPGTDFHEMNLEWLVDMCQKFVGLALNVSGDKLRLVNDKGEVVSSVTVSYAEKATVDKNGRDISTYIFSVEGVGDTVVFTHGDGTNTAVTIPYADKAKYDINGHELEDYIYNVQIAGDKLRISHGDGTIVDLTIPYAVKASTDVDGKDLTTYAASLAVDGDNVVLRDAKGRLLNSITVAYATRALNDGAGDEIEASYGDKLQAGTTTVKLISKDGTELSEITVPYATEASHADEADHATVATDATNAIETVSVSGDNIVFTTYGGTAYSITAPYAVKAQKDDLGNTIKTSYVANVTNDAQTGELQFRDAMGNIIVSLLPAVDTAKNDTYGNLIADYIKSIVVSQNSDYVTVTHGTGDVDTLTIHYAETAWKDTNNNVIKNTYIKYMECVEDVQDGHYKIVCYNGDNPMAELFRFEVTAYSAQTDINGKDLTTYVADVDYNANKQIKVTDGAGNTLKTLANKLNNVADVNINNALADGQFLAYDANSDEWVNAEMQVDLDDLTDVDTTGVADGDVLTYDANAGKWVNKPAGSGVKDVNNCSIGTFVDSNPSSWTVVDIMNGAYFRQDHALIAGDLPVLTFYDSNYTNPQSCGILDWRIHTNIVTLPYSPVAFFNEVALGTVDSAITSATVEMWFSYPEDSSKQIKVTLVIDVTNKLVTSDSATIVTVGGGGAGVPTDSYAVAGTIDTNANTYTANSTNFYNDCAYGKELVIQIDGSAVQAIPIGCGLENQDTSTYIPKRSFVDLIADIKAGVITSDVYTGYVQFVIPVNNAFALYRLAISVDASSGTIVQNTCQRQF